MTYKPDTTEQFSIALLIAAVAHALFIFGIGFKDLSPHQMKHTLSVTLAHAPAPSPVKKPDFLADADQEGGGVNEKVSESRMHPPSIPSLGEIPPVKPDTPPPPPIRKPLPNREKKPVLTQTSPSPKKKKLTVSDTEEKQIPPTPHLSLVDSLEEQISDVATGYTDNTDGGTKQKDTNINHQSETKKDVIRTHYEDSVKRKIKGTLRLTGKTIKGPDGIVDIRIAIGPDGNIVDTLIDQTSPYESVNENILQTVRSSAPFSPPPQELLQEGRFFIMLYKMQLATERTKVF